MPRGWGKRQCCFAGQRYGDERLFTTPPRSRTVGRSRTTGETGLDPANLVRHRVANHASRIEIGIPFPLNPIAMSAHASKRLSPNVWGNCRICIPRDDENWTIRASLAKLIAIKISAHEWIALPRVLHGRGCGQIWARGRGRARLLQLVVACHNLVGEHVSYQELKSRRLRGSWGREPRFPYLRLRWLLKRPRPHPWQSTSLPTAAQRRGLPGRN
jgi:hypothetical protein